MMRDSANTAGRSVTAAQVVLGLCLIFLLISTIQFTHHPLSAWNVRPSVVCEQGKPVHQTGTISAERVNIRALPTVFSDVVTQVNENHPVVVVCQFGAWSQIKEPDFDGPTWVSSGLVLLDDSQPLAFATKTGLIGVFLLSLGGLLLVRQRPGAINQGVAWVMQTGDLPEHAKPLISNPNARVSR